MTTALETNSEVQQLGGGTPPSLVSGHHVPSSEGTDGSARGATASIISMSMQQNQQMEVPHGMNHHHHGGFAVTAGTSQGFDDFGDLELGHEGDEQVRLG